MSDDVSQTGSGAPARVGGGERVFYRWDSSRASFRELWWDSRSPVTVLVLWITKLLRVRVPGSMNDPNVRTLSACEVGEGAIEAGIRGKLEEAGKELEGLGFVDNISIAIDDA